MHTTQTWRFDGARCDTTVEFLKNRLGEEVGVRLTSGSIIIESGSLEEATWKMREALHLSPDARIRKAQ